MYFCTFYGASDKRISSCWGSECSHELRSCFKWNRAFWPWGTMITRTENDLLCWLFGKPTTLTFFTYIRPGAINTVTWYRKNRSEVFLSFLMVAIGALARGSRQSNWQEFFVLDEQKLIHIQDVFAEHGSHVWICKDQINQWKNPTHFMDKLRWSEVEESSTYVGVGSTV